MELNAGLSAGTESSDAAGVSEDFEGSYPGGISGNTEVIEESGAGDEAMSGAWSESEAPAAEPAEEPTLWSQLPSRGPAGLLFRLVWYAAVGATLYFLLGAAGEAAGVVAAAISAEAGHLALLVYLREPRRKLPDKINALELLEVRAPEDLSETRRGGPEGRIRRAQIIAVAFGALGAVLVVMPLAFLGLGIGREELPLLEPVADVLGTMGGAAFAAVFGFAGGFWPNREKERVKELLAEAGDAREFEEAGEGGLVGESTTKPE